MQQKRSIINYFDIDLLLIFGELEPHTQSLPMPIHTNSKTLNVLRLKGKLELILMNFNSR